LDETIICDRKGILQHPFGKTCRLTMPLKTHDCVINRQTDRLSVTLLFEEKAVQYVKLENTLAYNYSNPPRSPVVLVSRSARSFASIKKKQHRSKIHRPCTCELFFQVIDLETL
jgi:hypothetical protein